MNAPGNLLESTVEEALTEEPLRVLHLEDDPRDRELVQANLIAEGFHFEVVHAMTRQEFENALERFPLDLILSDYSLPSYDGMAALKLAQEKRPETPFILLSGTIGEELAVESLKSGATDYVLKQNLDRLGHVVRRALREAKGRAERKSVEQALQKSEARLTNLIDIAVDAIISVDENQQVQLFNKGAEAVFGYRIEEVIGKPLDLLLPSRFVAGHRQHLRNFAAGSENARLMGGRRELFGRRKHGSEFPAEASISKQTIDGRLVFTAILRDITERKRAEDLLREQASLLDKAQDAILVAERLYGWPAEEALGESVETLLKIDPAGFQQAFEAVVAKGEWTGELKGVRKDGRGVIVEAHWALVRDSQGQAKSILDINTDISERRKTERQMLRAQRMESIGTLAGGVAHDLNNVLAPILMSVELLKLSPKYAEDEEILDGIKASASRGADLVKQVLSFARGVEGERVIVNVSHVLRELHKIIRDTFPKNIELSLKRGDKAWTVIGDATQLHQVFLNLCVNARDAMPNGGKLTMTVQNAVLDEVYCGMNPEAKPGTYLRVAIADTGTGTPREILDRIFEPFFTTKEVGKGTGLGLSTTLGIVRSHGGFINVYSEMGKGTSFKVYLPANTTATEAEGVAMEHTQLPRGNGELILVVDDEQNIRAVVQRTLELFGYRVLLACHGAEALAIYAEHRKQIAVVLTDMAMPIMDGPSMIVALKVMNPEIRIIGSSGLASNEMVARAVGAGVDHFIPKPYTAEAMLKTLATILNVKEP